MYPELLRATSAERYAVKYEEAYQYNSHLTTEGTQDTRQLSVDADASDSLTEAIGDGFLVGIDGELSVMQGEMIEDNPVVGVYYLTPHVGLRGDIPEPTLYDVEQLRSVTVKNRQTIYCDETADNQ
ncbi:hypothetical protein [Halomicrobium salinisoli]|uniref:hypothetical protein n=1 Tax=Halomicrobium salinisoli TaxID=2878391 RepID=UPI001CF03E1C|nr:hypothetical protein [Halomicrobium salinisoli]